MSSVLVDAAASISPPETVYVRATVSSSEAIQLPAEFRNNWISVQADAADVWVKFATATATASATATSTGLTPIAAATNGTVKIPAGQTMHFDLRQLNYGPEPKLSAWMAHISTVTTGYVRIWRSSGQK